MFRKKRRRRARVGTVDNAAVPPSSRHGPAYSCSDEDYYLCRLQSRLAVFVGRLRRPRFTRQIIHHPTSLPVHILPLCTSSG
ncbi:unnamed protein product [Vitrella brassicaformis CCMP3155]|uniref:Uncharacterized protein n=1 Tax=Vitrella brassicaformis (strain CCMP3155) TaxID=1169540 RepID=A0A0G4H1W1_VITBC|nr:unnamed protein product [Vitrella brassicaformis CCMP3155]|eukprot:CEM37610.1 unnamed protein product [Vitrella brassicaformis CCMP3155]